MIKNIIFGRYTKIEIERMLKLLTILWHDKKLEKMEVRNWEKKNKKVGFSLFKGNMDILHLICPRPFFPSILNTSLSLLFPLSLLFSSFNNHNTKIVCHLKLKMLQHFVQILSIAGKNLNKRTKISGHLAKTKMYK